MTENKPDANYISKNIYGSITVLAVLLIMTEHPPGAIAAVVTLFGTVLVVTLAEAYSEIVAELIVTEKRLTREEALRIWHHSRPILLGANVPTVVVIALGVTGLTSMEVALTIATYSVYAVLFLTGLAVGRHLNGTPLNILLSGLFTLSIGLLIGVLKVLMH